MSEPSATARERPVRRAALPVFVLALAASLAWLSAILLAPYLRSRGDAAAASFLYAVFAPVCHQIPSRSFFVRGFPLAVCARCLGIYAGALAGLLAYPFVRGFSRIGLPAGRLFLLLSLPISLDFAGGAFGLWSSPNGLRAATGFAWGLILPFYFVTGVVELVLWRSGRPLANRGEKT